MNIKEAIDEIIRKENGQYVPLDAIETEKLFSFFLVTKNGEAIGNNAQYIVTKDGKHCGWFTGGVPIPFLIEYPEYRGKLIKQWTKKELETMISG